MKKKHLLLTAAVTLLTACSSTTKSNYKVYQKKASPAHIKIDNLDLQKQQIQLRLEYRSYVFDALENMNCDISFNDLATLKLQLLQPIKLDAFSTEILTFDDIEITQQQSLLEQTSLKYSLKCRLIYDKGSEKVANDSVLHLAPNNIQRYR